MIRTCVRRLSIPLVTLASLVLLVAYGCGVSVSPSPDGAGETGLAAPPSSTTQAVTTQALASPTPVTPATPGLAASPDEPGLTCPMPSDEVDAAFVADVGLPNGSLVAPGATFRETWRLRNTGTCTWPEGTELVFISGDVIAGPQRAPVTQIGPGRDVEITVELTAPLQPARYASYWRLQAPGGQLFGAVIYTEIVVSSDVVAPVTIPEVVPPPSPTLRLVVTPIPTSLPTQSPTQTSAPYVFPTTSYGLTCRALDPRYAPVVQQAHALGIGLPCPTGSAVTGESGSFQVFWQEIDQSSPVVRLRSFVVVREATRTVYVLRGKDAATYNAEVRAYEDTWTAAMPEQPEACAPLVPPQGYIMPTRCIGNLWCKQSLWNSIGWPVAAAEAVTFVTQGDSSNLLLEVSGEGIGTYLLAIDLNARAATAYRVP